MTSTTALGPLLAMIDALSPAALYELERVLHARLHVELTPCGRAGGETQPADQPAADSRPATGPEVLRRVPPGREHFESPSG